MSGRTEEGGVALATPLGALRIGFIGAGRLGTALAWSLAGAGLRVVGVASSTRAKAQVLAARIAGCEVSSPQELAQTCDLVFITTPDGAIAQSAQAVRWRAGSAVVHCSGATEVNALAGAERDGALIGGFHPMQTFGDPAAAVVSLPGSTITIEAREPLDATLVALASRLGCRINRLPPGMRGRYHAAAGYASQFINALFAEAATIWQSWGATEVAALDALLPLAHGTLASIRSVGIAAGMPGPVSRGDVTSVDKHIAALSELGDGTAGFYRVMCASTVPLALAAGSIDEATANRIRGALDN